MTKSQHGYIFIEIRATRSFDVSNVCTNITSLTEQCTYGEDLYSPSNYQLYACKRIPDKSGIFSRISSIANTQLNCNDVYREEEAENNNNVYNSSVNDPGNSAITEIEETEAHTARREVNPHRSTVEKDADRSSFTSGNTAVKRKECGANANSMGGGSIFHAGRRDESDDSDGSFGRGRDFTATTRTLATSSDADIDVIRPDESTWTNRPAYLSSSKQQRSIRRRQTIRNASQP